MSLKGIIFGIKTKKEDKIKIMQSVRRMIGMISNFTKLFIHRQKKA